MTDKNTGNKNTGDLNTGNKNTGDLNTGDLNTGNLNTGDLNTGDLNTGNKNTGDLNTGNLNTGNWNVTNYETGFFNTIQSDTVRVFNKDALRSDWEKAKKPNFIYFALTKGIFESEITDAEKIEQPTFHYCDGYLKRYDYKEAFKKSWDDATTEDRELIKYLPNFDADVFFDISGIRVNDIKSDAKVIIIDGKTYESKEIKE